MSSSRNEIKKIKKRYHKTKRQQTVPFTYSWFWYMFFWTLVGAVGHNNSFTCHVQIFTSATPHYCPVLPPNFLFSSLQLEKNNKLEKLNKIWLKQGSGYHAISIHAELFNSYTLSNQILMYEMQQGTKKTFVSHLDWPPPPLSTQRRHDLHTDFNSKLKTL